MTDVYARLGRVNPEDFPLEAAVMHWSHSVVHEKFFTSFWQAQQDASDLAMELGVPEGFRVDCFSLPPRKKTVPFKVSFCDEVAVFLGDEENKEVQPVLLCHEELLHWEQKPWQLRPICSMSTSSVQTHRSDTEARPGQDRHHQGMRHVPAWHQEVRTLLDEEGQIDTAEDDDPVLYVSSYYINHLRHRFQDQARIIRFGSDSNEWEEDVRFIWEDLIEPEVVFDILIVRPTPPFFAFRGTSATVIVQQRPQPDRVACLTTAILPLSPDFRVIAAAHSATHTMAYRDIIRIAGVEAICTHREQSGFGLCTLLVGLFPLDPAHEVHLHPGIGFTIRVPPPMNEEEVEHNAMIRYADQERAPERAPNDAPEDTVSFMARQPRRAVPLPSSSPSTSSSTSDSMASRSHREASRSTSRSSDNRQTVIFSTTGGPRSLLLPWENGDALFAMIAEIFDCSASDIQDVHYVSQRPHDLELQNLQGLLLQKITDVRPSVFMRMVLVDVETYEDDLLQPQRFRDSSNGFHRLSTGPRSCAC